MMNQNKSLIRLLWITIFVFGSLLIMTSGQESDESPITLMGAVQTVDADIIVVSGLQVDMSGLGDEVITQIQVGTTVSISGNIQDAVVTATAIVIVNIPAPEATDEPTPEVTPEVEATTEATDDNNDDIIIIEGPVDYIGINIITIFGIEIEVDPDDPILTQIEIGEIVRIEGIGDFEDGTLIIVSVNITVVNIVIVTGGSGTGGNPPPPQQPPPTSNRFNKDACKKGGWQGLSRADGSGFKNQGDCIQYTNTGK
jgi:hypothetical protein